MNIIAGLIFAGSMAATFLLLILFPNIMTWSEQTIGYKKTFGIFISLVLILFFFLGAFLT